MWDWQEYNPELPHHNCREQDVKVHEETGKKILEGWFVPILKNVGRFYRALYSCGEVR